MYSVRLVISRVAATARSATYIWSSAPVSRALCAEPVQQLRALSAVDGRYCAATRPLSDWLSEAALIEHRLTAEVAWLKALRGLPIAPPLPQRHWNALDDVLRDFDARGAARVKEIEQVTRHDVKAVEYYLREKVRPLQ